ncbi:fatty acid synthase-like [Vespula maculifrons]|uniref:Fatty acid synthase-like n=1 Tax=Vespula maculifrons TaxID=7453 RepID=A0ABD2CT27_VESMC
MMNSITRMIFEHTYEATVDADIIPEDTRDTRTDVRGDLSTICWIEEPITKNYQNENLISIYYATLNFKDVMLLMGEIALEVDGRKNIDCVIGFEYSGINISIFLKFLSIERKIFFGLYLKNGVYTMQLQYSKRKFIKETFSSIDEHHIEILEMQRTDGASVGLLLNSLVEDILQLSLRCWSIRDDF